MPGHDIRNRVAANKLRDCGIVICNQFAMSAFGTGPFPKGGGVKAKDVMTANAACYTPQATAQDEVGRLVERVSEPTDGPRTERHVGVEVGDGGGPGPPRGSLLRASRRVSARAAPSHDLGSEGEPVLNIAALQGPGWCPMCPMMGPWGWGWMILWALFWLLIIVAVIWLFYRIAKTQGWIGEGRRSEVRAEELLHERYARGEIDRETYERMLEDLRRGRAA